jgi:hypothetical protein
MGMWGIHMGMPPLFAGCSISLVSGYRSYSGEETITPVSWFTSDTGHYLFNTKIDVFKNHFSGLMIVKPEPNESYRVVFITEVGLKIFDMGFLPDSQVNIHYMMDAMNRKKLIKILSNDISLVLMNGLKVRKPEMLAHTNPNHIVFRYRNGNRRNDYLLSEDSKKPYLAKQTACFTNKVKAELYGNPVSGIDSVKIKHYHLRLSIDLYRINEHNHVTE